MSNPTIVCTLGMHRSGTSLVSRVLNVLGVYLGPEEHLMRPSSDNPTGHWESRPIKEINDEILSILGGSWSEPPPLPAGLGAQPRAGRAQAPGPRDHPGRFLRTPICGGSRTPEPPSRCRSGSASSTRCGT